MAVGREHCFAVEPFQPSRSLSAAQKDDLVLAAIRDQRLGQLDRHGEHSHAPRPPASGHVNGKPHLGNVNYPLQCAVRASAGISLISTLHRCLGLSCCLRPVRFHGSRRTSGRPPSGPPRRVAKWCVTDQASGWLVGNQVGPPMNRLSFPSLKSKSAVGPWGHDSKCQSRAR